MAMGADGNFEYGETIATPPGLISYPQVWEAVPNEFRDGKIEFSCTILIPKNGANLEFLVSESMKPVKRLFGEQYSRLKEFGDHCPIKDGDDKGPEHANYGHWVIKATAAKNRRPFVVDKSSRPIGEHSEIYGGAIGQLWVTPMAYNTKIYRGVKFFLAGVQKIADGKPFGRIAFDPGATGYKAPDVPDYLKAHVEDRKPAFAAVPAGVSESEADRAMKRALASPKPGFSGDIDDNTTPF